MAKSEITHCLEIIDFYEHDLIFNLKPEEKLIINYCIKQGAKNNIGIFKKNRGAISFYLRTDDKLTHDFFLNHPELVGFDEKNHLIWVKPFYEFVEFGLFQPTERTVTNRTTKETKTIMAKGFYNKTNFISKVNSGFRKDSFLNAFKVAWVNHNWEFLNRLNEEVRNSKGNKHNFDALLSLAQKKLLTGV